ncbi:MAG: glycoside hydrolase family 5 protein [Anaerolineae bacterium]|nr:glycoside hydrolase family 5 protein [Anaerolineae bacterium]
MMIFEIHPGTNISHWLSQSTARGEARRQWFVEEDVKRLADLGFDHLRIPIDEEQMWDESGQREQEAFELLNRALDWLERAGLRAIVDLHILRSHHFNDANEPALYSDPAALEQFADLWRDLSAFMKERATDKVAYEMLNEAVARNPESWNHVSGYIFKTLRDLEPERTIVLGSNQWNKTYTYPDLKIPEDDHLLLTFHYYNPMFVTHYKASWNEYRHYTGPVQYPGTPVPAEHMDELKQLYDDAETRNRYYDREVIKQEVMIASEIAQKTNHPLYCGEFGVIINTPSDVRQRWYQDMVSVFDELGIAWANWDYKGGFGIFTRDLSAETGIRSALLG